MCVCVSCFPCIFCLFCSQISRVWSEIPMMNFEGALARKPMVFGFFGPQNMLKKHTSSRCSECGKTGLITTKNRLLWRWCVPMSLSVLLMDFAIFYHVFLLNVFLIGTTIWNTFQGLSSSSHGSHGHMTPLSNPRSGWHCPPLWSTRAV